MNNKVDYHLHTYYSDGSMSPTDIVKRANDMEYMEIAITDHDGIDGVREAQIAGNALGLSVISGIELAAKLDDEEAWGEISLHILGHRINIKNKELLAELAIIKEKREQRNEKLLKALADMGYELTEEDLFFSEEQEYIGKPLIARAMCKKGYIQDPKEAFEAGKFLESPEIASIKKDKITVYRAIELIKGASGTASLAHPMKIKGLGERGSEEFYANLDKMLRKLKIAGLGGLECFHSAHSEEESLKLVSLAEKYHLHILAGSDYHGPEFEEGVPGSKE